MAAVVHDFSRPPAFAEQECRGLEHLVGLTTLHLDIETEELGRLIIDPHARPMLDANLGRIALAAVRLNNIVAELSKAAAGRAA